MCHIVNMMLEYQKNEHEKSGTCDSAEPLELNLQFSLLKSVSSSRLPILPKLPMKATMPTMARVKNLLLESMKNGKPRTKVIRLLTRGKCFQ